MKKVWAFSFCVLFLGFEVLGGQPVEILVAGNSRLEWTAKQETICCKKQLVSPLPLLNISEIESLFSSDIEIKMDAEKERLWKHVKPYNAQIVRFHGIENVRTETDKVNLRKWEEVPLFSPVGKAVGQYDWEFMSVRALHNYYGFLSLFEPGFQETRNLLSVLTPESFFTKEKLARALDKSGDFGTSFLCGTLSTSLISPQKMHCWGPCGIIFDQVPTSNILAANKTDLAVPQARYSNYGDYPKSLYRALRKGVSSPQEVCQPNSSEERPYNKIWVQPFNAEANTSLAIAGFFIKESSKEVAEAGYAYILKLAKELDLPCVFISQEH